MEWFDWKMAVLAAGVVLLVPGWLLWRFFRGLFRIYLVIFLILVAGVGYIYHRSTIPVRRQGIGRHAYLIENGKYLGIVEGEGDDRTRGEVWVIRPPGRYPLIYSKNRVRLEETRVATPTPGS